MKFSLYKHSLILGDNRIVIKEWSEKNKIPMFLALTNVETKKYW